MSRRADPARHASGDLAAYAAGAIPPGQAAAVAAHLRACPACRAELAGWRALAAGARALDREASVAMPPPDPATLRRAWAEIERRRACGWRPGRPAAARMLGLLLQLLRAQIRVVPRGVWPLSAAAVGAGLLLAAAVPRAGVAGTLLGLIVCAIGGVSVAFSCGPDAEPCPDLAHSLPVPPRLVLLSRLGLLFCFDTLLGLGGSAVVVSLHGASSLWTVSGLWFGPFLALGALSAVLAVVWGSVAAASGTLALWAVRLFGGPVVAALWRTNGPVLGCAAVLLMVAVAWRPRLA